MKPPHWNGPSPGALAVVLSWTLTICGALLISAGDVHAQDPEGDAVDIAEMPWWEVALTKLGGVEVGGFAGLAQVSANKANGDEVASGTALLEGFHLSLYTPPETWGWDLRPTFGVTSENFDIADFDEALPNREPNFGEEVSAQCSDPETGTFEACRQINSYKLNLRSVALGLEGGYHIVRERGHLRPFATAIVGFKVAEFRTATIRIGNQPESSFNQLAFFQAAGGRLDLGVSWPAAHVALRAIASYDLYARFNLDKPAEFAGDVVCDPEFGRCSRERVFIKQTSMNITRITLALSVFY